MILVDENCIFILEKTAYLHFFWFHTFSSDCSCSFELALGNFFFLQWVSLISTVFQRVSPLLSPDSLELVYSCSVHKVNKEDETGIRDCNEGLSSDVLSLGVIFGGLGHVPHMLILLGVAASYQHLSKLRYFLSGNTHVCIRLQNLFYLAAGNNSNWNFWQYNDHELRGF